MAEACGAAEDDEVFATFLAPALTCVFLAFSRAFFFSSLARGDLFGLDAIGLGLPGHLVDDHVGPGRACAQQPFELRDDGVGQPGADLRRRRPALITAEMLERVPQLVPAVVPRQRLHMHHRVRVTLSRRQGRPGQRLDLLAQEARGLDERTLGIFDHDPLALASGPLASSRLSMTRSRMPAKAGC